MAAAEVVADIGDVGFHGGIFGAGGGVGVRREGWDSEKRYDLAISVGGPGRHLLRKASNFEIT